MSAPEARLDLERRQRLGMVEAVWGEHKSATQIVAILQTMHHAGELALVTRVDPVKAAEVKARCPEFRCTRLPPVSPWAIFRQVMASLWWRC